MSTKFVDNVFLETEECCNCGMVFAMTQDFMNRRRKDRKSLYCPAGHPQHYCGETEEQKLKRKLQQAEQEAQRQQHRAIQATSERDASNRRYARIRDRVKNGVCPCCTRTFENLARHMATKHPDFGNDRMLRTMRETYGLSQVDLAKEIWIPASYVSMYENKRPGVPEYAIDRIKVWLDEQ